MDLQNSQKTINKMAIVSLSLLIIILKVNRLNSLIKICNMAEGIKKNQDPMICLLPTRLTSTLKTESKATKKKIFQANDSKMQGVAILIIDKINFKYVESNKERHYRMI